LDHENNPKDTFMSVPLHLMDDILEEFVHDHDQYPVHWVMHIIHAYQVLGHKHPTLKAQVRCLGFYNSMCRAFHLYSESGGEMNDRLKD
jgi:hypothetical protein